MSATDNNLIEVSVFISANHYAAAKKLLEMKDPELNVIGANAQYTNLDQLLGLILEVAIEERVAKISP